MCYFHISHHAVCDVADKVQYVQFSIKQTEPYLGHTPGKRWSCSQTAPNRSPPLSWRDLPSLSHARRPMSHNKLSDVKLHIQATFAFPDGSGTSCCILRCWWRPSAKNTRLWPEATGDVHQEAASLPGPVRTTFLAGDREQLASCFILGMLAVPCKALDRRCWRYLIICEQQQELEQGAKAHVRHGGILIYNLQKIKFTRFSAIQLYTSV